MSDIYRTVCASGEPHAEFFVADSSRLAKRLRQVLDYDDRTEPEGQPCGPHAAQVSHDGLTWEAIS